MTIITLLIEDQTFQVQKNVLCEYSDYFSAMFSGNYVEKDQDEIKISMVDASSMNLIVNYMKNGLIDLSKLSLGVFYGLAHSATFLQMTELLKQIEYTLNTQLCLSNWISIMDLAEASSFPKLEIYSAIFGLLNFKFMKTEYFANITKLYWYLSHPYLTNETEVSVFEFGFQWITEHQMSADAALVILGCLNITLLTKQHLQKIQTYIQPQEHSLAHKVVSCMQDILAKDKVISASNIVKNRMTIVEGHTQSVYTEVLHLVEESVVREDLLVACIPASRVDAGKAEVGAQFLYKLEGRTLERWVEYPERNVWGWSVTGGTIAGGLAVAGGEYGRGSGVFQRDVITWDPLHSSHSPQSAVSPQWTRHGALLPPRRHAGLAMHQDKLYIVGGVGQFRIVLSSVQVYDMRDGTTRKVAELPDAIQSPALCVHRSRLYVASERAVYRLSEGEQTDRWEMVMATSFRPNSLVSYGRHVYVSQRYYCTLMRFRPDRDRHLRHCCSFRHPVVAICNIGKRIIAFTQDSTSEQCTVAVEAYHVGDEDDARDVEEAEARVLNDVRDAGDISHDSREGRIEVLWSDSQSDIKFNEVSGCCALVPRAPALSAARAASLSTRHAKHYLQRLT